LKKNLSLFSPDGDDSRQTDEEDQHSASHQTMHLYTRNKKQWL